jgi:hypothetical protein
MTEPLLNERERLVVRDLTQLLAEGTDAEPEMERRHKAEMEDTEQRFQEGRRSQTSQHQAEQEAVADELKAARLRIKQEFEAEHAAIERELNETRVRISEEYSYTRHKIKAVFKEARWTIQAMGEANKNRAEAEYKEAQERVAEQRRKMKALQQEANKLAEDWRRDADAELGLPPAPEPAEPELPATVAGAIKAAEEELAELREDTLPAYFKRRRLLWSLVGLWLLVLVPVPFVLQLDLPLVVYWLAGAGLSAVLFGAIGRTWVTGSTRREVLATYRPVTQTLAHAATLCTRYLQHVKRKYGRTVARSKKKHSRALRKAHTKYLDERQASKQRRRTAWRALVQRLRVRAAAAQKRRDAETTAAEETHQRLQAEIKQRYESSWAQLHDGYFHELEQGKKVHDHDWRSLVARWHEGVGHIATEIAELNRESRALFPLWTDSVWEAWTPPTAIPPAIRFGEIAVDPDQIGNGLPLDERLRAPSLIPFTLPACLDFPERCSLLYKAADEGRDRAVESLQTVMLRFLTGLPPGKVRFTIIDPVGLGQNFAAFMHLADYDEQLVASRIWTELPHIEQRLADLTGHMENVIQKYLRNQFETIEEYNANAGEVAEPYRVLVVANFPANFSVEAVRRLVSIANSGPRCGVYTLITVDTKQPLPQGFQLADLEQPSVSLLWDKGRFRWKDADFEKYPLQLDMPPSAEFCTQLMHRVGAKAKLANRVEVPFEFIAPPPERWWRADSRTGIDVPLGRAGATKRQNLHLGHGTAHHVLIAGKTGSGKSTLLHALIVNLALCYSPEEVELYLVDFKKGVEFKTYATFELPHARVVAVESEREFGLSVLQRLDAELRQRGDRFREAGAQNLAAYRDSNGAAQAPRIMLIVDEFQEFFIEDDKISQEAAQILDRLVRQGRAFGLHVLLGSQTLGGAYTLARATIDQMAVRIALQCSDADGHIILSDDNSAARLLSRPGEAIYNDANGLVEGNNPFQVVWLSDEDREAYLRAIHEKDPLHGHRPQIVFEGNAPAHVANNHLLAELLENPSAAPARRGDYAWLGEAMAIKDPTAAVFRTQSGSNLLMVGQHEEQALGVMSAALVSLAAQHSLGDINGRGVGSRFFVLDGTTDDSPHLGLLARVAGVLPQTVRVGDWRDLAAIIGELAEEVERRQKANETRGPIQYLLVHGLQRFRDLRKQDDDFSFARRGEDKPSAAKQFLTILRDGPLVGAHTLVWCDTLNNVTRSLDRQAIREFEMRVLFQMSATDSSVLIDSPAAGKLGLHRALFHSEDQGKLEKFRPYGLPSESWLAEVDRQLKAGRAEAVV